MSALLLPARVYSSKDGPLPTETYDETYALDNAERVTIAI